jgi:tetratricopeptide (TPR) repeat protein
MKVKNKIYQLLTIAVITGVSFSCSDDFYNESIGNKITPEQHYTSQRDLKALLNGVFVPLQTAVPNLLLLDGLRSDMLDVTSTSDSYMKEINNQEKLSVNNPYLDGEDFYKAIITINEILKNIDQVWVKDPTTNLSFPKYYTGAFITTRAWCYFNIVRIYGEAALINDNLPTYQTIQTFLSKKVMIDTLINQIKPYVINTTLINEAPYFGPNTKMLLGELYLENNNYDSAAYYLKIGLESFGNDIGNYKVTSRFSKELWGEIFYNDKFDFFAKGIENISLIKYDLFKKQNNKFVEWSQSRKIQPSNVIVNLFNTQLSTTGDFGDKWRGADLTFDTVKGTTDYYVSKYMIQKGDPLSNYIPINRAADVHLLLAEALNRKGDTALAMALLNKGIKNMDNIPDEYFRWINNIGVRGRVDLEKKVIPAGVDMSNPSAVTNAIEDLIIEERAMELAYEGKRWFDLVRIAERRNDPSYLADKVAAKFSDPAKASQIRNKLMDPKSWYLK